MKKSTLFFILLSTTFVGKGQSLGHITITNFPPCGTTAPYSFIKASPIAGATSYIWFSPMAQQPTILIDGNLIPTSTTSDSVSISTIATQQSIIICVYAINACCTTDTGCRVLNIPLPPPFLSPSNSPIALPNSSGIYSVLPPLPTCAIGVEWNITPSSAGSIAGSGNDTVTVNFSASFTSCLLCAGFLHAYNVNGPDKCIDITLPVGINDFSENNIIGIYPNPAGEELFIKSNSLTGKAEIIITDILGKEILRKQFLTSDLRLPIFHFNSGIYFLEINNGKNIYRKKFLKK